MKSMKLKNPIQVIVTIKGRQHLVQPDDQLVVDKLSGKPGDKIKFNQVLLVIDGDKINVGQPTVKAEVEAEIIEQVRTPKVKVFHYKAKSRSRKTKGQRQELTKIKISKIKLAKK